jgi:Pentapeptide repeats (8 copies)
MLPSLPPMSPDNDPLPGLGTRNLLELVECATRPSSCTACGSRIGRPYRSIPTHRPPISATAQHRQSDGLYQPSERLTLKGDRRNQHLRNRSLSLVILDESRLYAADMIGADLRHASLFGAKLTSASLFFANLTRANMTAANLTGTNLRSADRDHAKGLTQAQLVGACGTPMAMPSHPPSLILDRPCPPRPSKPVDPD